MTQNETMKPGRAPVPENSPPTPPFVLQAAGFSEEVPGLFGNPQAWGQGLARVVITSELSDSETIEK